VATERIDFIDGERLVDAVVGGSEWVASKRIHLNEINVFPVPDGDTGTNLTLTLKAASDAVRPLRDRSLGEVASALSRAVLLGARGNAGIILAQFIRGFAREVQGVERLYPRGLADALAGSVEGAYEAMEEPVEGTILTVIRESVDELKRLVESGETDYVALLGGMHGAAAASLERTPELLPVLKEAGVVDAGGEGYVDLIEGALRQFTGEPIEAVLDTLQGQPRLPHIKEHDLKYRYCTEFLLEGPEVDVGDLKVRMAGMGGSLVVVGGAGLARVHIHTNEPEKVLSVAGEMGSIERRKIDDMREQHREFIRTAVNRAERGAAGGGTTNGAVPEASTGGGTTNGSMPEASTGGGRIEGSMPEASSGGGRTGGEGDAATGAERGARRRRGQARDRRRRSVRIVTDSTADLPRGVAEDLGVTVVPLIVNFEDGSFRDGVDITGKAFFDKLESAAVLPTTSQPSPQNFVDVYEELSWETRAILSIHISSGISGTVQSAAAAAARAGGVEVRVVDSGLVCAPLGLVVEEVARAAQRGAGLTELTTLASNLSVRGRVLFTVGSLDHLVRGGRIGRAKAWAGKLARVKPILTIEEGVIAPAGRAHGDGGVLEKMIELAGPELAGGSGGTLAVVSAGRADMVSRLVDAFKDRFRFDAVQVFELGAIVGTHAGPGTWGVSYLRRRPAR
jgi:DegV family protein with EDD domain